MWKRKGLNSEYVCSVGGGGWLFFFFNNTVSTMSWGSKNMGKDGGGKGGENALTSKTFPACL